MGNVAVSQAVVLEGHLLDSLTLAKVIDTIQKQGGEYTFNHIQVGNRKQDISSAHLTLSAPDEAKLKALLDLLAPYGVKVSDENDAKLAPCPANGKPPENAIPVKMPVEVRINGEWVDVSNEGGEFYTVVSPTDKLAVLKHRDDLAQGDQVVVSQTGVEWH